MLEEGKKAPLFTLPDCDGNNVALKDCLGKKVILYFYPKDMTSGCTVEACDFRDSFPNFNKTKAVVLGVSADSSSSHRKFSDKYDLSSCPIVLFKDLKTDFDCIVFLIMHKPELY